MIENGSRGYGVAKKLRPLGILAPLEVEAEQTVF